MFFVHKHKLSNDGTGDRTWCHSNVKVARWTMFSNVKKWVFTSASFCLFSVIFKQATQILQQIDVKNVYPVSGGCWDSNSQPSDYESPPLTTRPGFPTFSLNCFFYLKTLTKIGILLNIVRANEGS